MHFYARHTMRHGLAHETIIEWHPPLGHQEQRDVMVRLDRVFSSEPCEECAAHEVEIASLEDHLSVKSSDLVASQNDVNRLRDDMKQIMVLLDAFVANTTTGRSNSDTDSLLRDISSIARGGRTNE